MSHQPVIDIHCDLLSYMLNSPQPDPFQREGIGCTFPHLADGNVKLQVLAIYTSTEKGSSELGKRQSLIFKNFLTKYDHHLDLIDNSSALNNIFNSSKLGVIAAIENASGFCEEDEPLENGFEKLEEIIRHTEKVLYIGLTHHTENRFGGGNNSNIGLKEDGKSLLNYINDRKIAIDFSHTSDALAYDILDYITKHDLNIPVIASHSNYRSIFNHVRNLPDIIAKEIIKRKGVIGVNFLRAFVNNDDPNAIYDHIKYGIELGGLDSICFGADYFYTGNHPDQSRVPFFFEEHENASCYPSIIKNIDRQISSDIAQKIAHENVINFMNRIWK